MYFNGVTVLQRYKIEEEQEEKPIEADDDLNDMEIGERVVRDRRMRIRIEGHNLNLIDKFGLRKEFL